jgi:hypothetical protein
VLSDFILDEVRRVLTYPRLQTRWGLSADDIESFLDELRTQASS